MKRCSISLVIREMYIKLILGYPLTPTRMAKIRKTNNNNVGKDAFKLEPYSLLVESYNGTPILENNSAAPQNFKHRVTMV